MLTPKERKELDFAIASFNATVAIAIWQLERLEK